MIKAQKKSKTNKFDVDLFYWPTPNGHKISILLEELNISYRIKAINILKDDQFKPSFLKISPNNKIPAIIDYKPRRRKSPIAVFESGAILYYFGAKTNKLIGKTAAEKLEVLQWLMWQVAGLGPMAGQNHHFGFYSKEKIPYAINRYVNETKRLYSVLNKRLKSRKFITDNYSIADIACYPWILSHERQQIDLTDYPNIKNWFESLSLRPAIKRAYEKATPYLD